MKKILILFLFLMFIVNIKAEELDLADKDRLELCIINDFPMFEYDEKEDPLPFDVEAPVIEIEDRDYALWFRDFAEDIGKYEGKR